MCTMRRVARRQFLRIAVGGAAALPFVTRFAWAEAYPMRPVRFFVPFAAGAVNDITARLIGQWLTERLGQQFLVENRPGGGSNIGIEAVVRAAADGYTLLAVGTTAAVNATLFERLNYNFIRDVAPVASIARVPHVMQVNPSAPATTVHEFITYAKANPAKISIGSGGIGSPAHVIGEHFKMITGANLAHLPIRPGAPALTDLIGEQIRAAFIDMAASIECIRAGKLRALAVTTAMRSVALPEMPTIGDFVPGFEANEWVGLHAPKNTPSEIIGKLNAEINAGLADPKLGRGLPGVLAGSPADFGKLIADDTAIT
jgi:tripartite-type tricarboxylate transporter receptor subunit TctC